MPAASSATLSDAQIAAYARAAGLPESQIATAVAIARAESSGNPRAYNGTPPDKSYGLWQINMIGTLGPARRKSLGISSNEALYDPAVNARAMVQISNRGTNWRPWTTYTGGRYKAYLSTSPGSSGPVEKLRDILPGGESVWNAGESAGQAVGGPLRELNATLATLGETFRRQSWNWLVVLIAVVLLILGVVILNRNNIRKGAKVATKIVGAVK